MKQPGSRLWKLRSCWGSRPRTTVKNKSDTRVSVFFCWVYPLLGKRPTGEYIYGIFILKIVSKYLPVG